MKKYCIIGTGRQGTAAAYDLLRFAKIHTLVLIDSNSKSISQCLKKIENFKREVIFKTHIIDINDSKKITECLIDCDIFLSSVPYKYNLLLTKCAIDSKTSMVDLGGHTENVIEQLAYNKDAVKQNITIVPDCGMGPGMNVTMALLAMEHLDISEEVRIWDGGLPRKPKAPWNYSLFFNIAGLTNEYDAYAFFLKDKKINKVECFNDIENIDFGPKIGILEAAVTSGGLSTMPWTYKGKLNILENKTLRYLGHWEWMKAYRELGLYSEKNINYNNIKINLRDFYHFLLEPKLNTGDRDDICIMRIEAVGVKDGKRKKIIIDCIETYDSKTDLMAMEKWTGWHASIMMQHIMDKRINHGAFPIEKALPGKAFYKAALKRNYKININEELI